MELIFYIVLAIILITALVFYIISLVKMFKAKNYIKDYNAIHSEVNEIYSSGDITKIMSIKILCVFLAVLFLLINSVCYAISTGYKYFFYVTIVFQLLYIINKIVLAVELSKENDYIANSNLGIRIFNIINIIFAFFVYGLELYAYINSFYVFRTFSSFFLLFCIAAFVFLLSGFITYILLGTFSSKVIKGYTIYFDKNYMDGNTINKANIQNQKTQNFPSFSNVNLQNENQIGQNNVAIQGIDNKFTQKNVNAKMKQGSYFTGNVLKLIGLNLLLILITSMTFGLALPWVYNTKIKFYIKNTVLNGKQLGFKGTGGKLFLQYIKWWFLTIFTVGFFVFFIPYNLEKWKISQTYIIE